MLEALRWLWMSTLLTGIVFLVVRGFDALLGRRVSPRVRVFAYGLVFVRLLLPAEADRSTAVIPVEVVAVEAIAETSAPVARQAQRAELPWARIAYGIGAVLVAGGFALSAWRERRVLASSRAERSADGGTVHVHAEVGPAVIGVLRPRVVVPRSFEALPLAVRRSVLAHERAHIRGGDPWISLGLRIALVLAWPIVPCWLAARRIRALLEIRADARAVRDAGLEPTAFGRALVGLTQVGAGRWQPSLSGYRALAERVQALRQPVAASRWRTAGLCTVAAFGVACSVQAVAPTIEVTLEPTEDPAPPEDEAFVQLRGSAQIKVRQPSIAWGTTSTIASIEAAALRYAERFPGSPIVVSDISARRGGHLAPHRTHREGREVDIWWPTDGDGAFAADQAWALLQAVLVGGNVEQVGIDPSLRSALRDAAERDGASAEQLATLEPVEPGPRVGGVRHLHVRFAR